MLVRLGSPAPDPNRMNENELREYIHQKEKEINRLFRRTVSVLLLIGVVLSFSILPAALHYTVPLPLQLLGGIILGMLAAVVLPAFAPFFLLAMLGMVGAGAVGAGLGVMSLLFLHTGQKIWPGD